METTPEEDVLCADHMAQLKSINIVFVKKIWNEIEAEYIIEE